MCGVSKSGMATSLDKLRYDLLQFSSISTGCAPQLAVLSVAACRKLRDSAENKLMSTANFLASALGTAARHSMTVKESFNVARLCDREHR